MGRQVQMSAELPAGSHNARPFRDGVLFNDTESYALRYVGRGEGREDRALRVPRYPRDAPASWPGRECVARQEFARGLCVLSDTVVAGGSSPSTISIYDLPANRRVALRQPDPGRAKCYPWA